MKSCCHPTCTCSFRSVFQISVTWVHLQLAHWKPVKWRETQLDFCVTIRKLIIISCASVIGYQHFIKKIIWKWNVLLHCPLHRKWVRFEFPPSSSFGNSSLLNFNFPLKLWPCSGRGKVNRYFQEANKASVTNILLKRRRMWAYQ